ncbi:MAG: hypothetical protein QG641_2224, partial [Candidatus Poribacteria bacterium]|nr:hypothetical protein [Candidatus Poribacteria bacterium]
YPSKKRKSQLQNNPTTSVTIPSLKPLLELQTYTARSSDAESMREATADAQGYTWFTRVAMGKDAPLYRFDGKLFTTIDNITSARLYVRDSKGKVWIGGDNGVACLWNGKVEKHYTVNDGLPDNNVFKILVDKDEGVWVWTLRGISYIHREYWVDRVSVVVDSRGLGIYDFQVDSKGGIWWFHHRRPKMMTAYRMMKTPQRTLEVMKIQLSGTFSGYAAQSVSEGILLRFHLGPLLYLRSDGLSYVFDNNISNYLETDSKGRLYFSVEDKNGQMTIIRDEPDSDGYFGYPDSHKRFVFPTKISTAYDYFKKFRDEIWIFNWVADKPVFIIRGNEILPGKDLYPSHLMDGGYFMIIDDETIWARKWGKREIVEFYIPKEMEYELCDLDVNGLTPLQYNSKTQSYYFGYHPVTEQTQYLVSYRKGEWKKLFDLGEFAISTDDQGNTWIKCWIKDSSRLVCITANGEILQQTISFDSFSADDKGGCYLLNQNGMIIYYKKNIIMKYRLPDIKIAGNVKAFSDGSVYIQVENALYNWTPKSLRRISKEDGMPDGKIEWISKTHTRLFFKLSGRVGWIKNGLISLVDMRRYPQLKDITSAQEDEKGRIFFYGAPDEKPVKEIWMLEGETLKELPLPESIPPYLWLILSDGEVILCSGPESKIYRYNNENMKFYILKNVGDFFGYIWGGYIAKGHLIVSGWGKHFIKIDLSKTSPVFPVLKFQGISIDKEPVEYQEIHIIKPSSVIKTDYLAIEKLSQTKVFYQTRLVGLDNSWSEPTKNESVEFRNLPSGNYRLEIRVKGESELWGSPIGFDIKVTPPSLYKRTGFIIGAILTAFLVPTSISTFLIKRRKKQIFEAISNPYIVGNPIRSDDMFFGREDDFRFVQAKLGTGETGLVIVFAGERRSGKTSILFQILNGRLGDQFVPILLDMQAMTVDNEAEFFEKIASEINSSLDERISIPTNAFRGGNPTRPFEKFIADVMTILDSKSLLFLFDEYELLETKIDDGVLRPDIITFFASLLEKYTKLSFIFTGSRHLEQRNPRYWSILIGKSIYRKISFLSELDTMRLIK